MPLIFLKEILTHSGKYGNDCKNFFLNIKNF